MKRFHLNTLKHLNGELNDYMNGIIAVSVLYDSFLTTVDSCTSFEYGLPKAHAFALQLPLLAAGQGIREESLQRPLHDSGFCGVAGQCRKTKVYSLENFYG